MRPFTHTISLADALAMVRDTAMPVGGTEVVAVAEAAWRVASRDVVAAVDVPPFDRAAMDGYAVRAADTAAAAHDTPAALTRIGVVYSGEWWRGEMQAGECVEIATGAPVPPGADAVVMVEQTRAVGGRVEVLAPVRPGQHVGPRGSDIAAGQAALRAGDQLTPARLGAMAAVGVTGVEVYRQPRVFIASTGNELVQPGARLVAGRIFDVNTVTLPPIVSLHGGVPVVHAPVGDTLDDLRAALDAGREADLVVMSGGSSVGERDLLVDAASERGEILFHGIAVKPGKPTLFARLGRQLLLGLPGNPTSCLSNAYLLLVPLLRATARLPPHVPETRRVRLARAIASPSDRHQFFTVRIEEGQALPAFKGSGDVTSMAGADGYIEIPAGVARIEAGTEVEVTLF